MNMPSSSWLYEMLEVTCRIFAPAAAQTIPIPPILINSTVLDHLVLRCTLKYFEPDHPRFTEGFVTDEVTAYVEAMANTERTVRNKKATSGAIFVSPPGYMYLSRTRQEFLYLLLKAVYPRYLVFFIMTPNLRISANTWRPCETSYPAFLAEISKALQAYNGYKGNSQLLTDEATAYDFGMQMAHRSTDEQGVRQLIDPNEDERIILVDSLWYERRHESTRDERTHDPKFHNELAALFKKTESIKHQLSDTTVFPIAATSIDARTDMVFPTLVLLAVIARDLLRRNAEEPRQTFLSWYQLLREPLVLSAERHRLAFPIFLHNISSFWLTSLVQAEYNLDEQQVKFNVEAMEKATISKEPSVPGGRWQRERLQRPLPRATEHDVRQGQRVPL